MMREDLEAFAADLENYARQDEKLAGNSLLTHDAQQLIYGKAGGLQFAASLLRMRLAKSEAAPLCDNCNHPPHEAHECSGRNQERGLSRGCECQTHTVAP